MRTSSLLLIAVALGTASGCKPAADKAEKVDTAAEEAAIRLKEAKWVDAYAKKDSVGLAGQYAEDAALANPGTALATDAAARKAILDGVAADPALKVDFASDRIIVATSGDLASSRGHYTMTYTDPGTKQPKTEAGNYLTVYRKAADGSWQAVEDFITPGASAAAQ
jgi:ketosteroid isomerase-like protein